MKVFLACIVMLNSFVIKAQLSDEEIHKVDSLKKIVSKTKSDTVRIRALLSWDDLIYVSDPELDLKINREIENICLQNFKKRLDKREAEFYELSYGKSLTIIGNAYFMHAKYEKALSYYQRSLKFNKKLGNKKGIASALNNSGLVYRSQGDNARAIISFTAALKNYELTGDKHGSAEALGNIGVIYYFQGELDQAIGYYMKSYDILKTGKDELAVANCLSYLGNIYFDKKDYKKAMRFFTESSDIFVKIGYKAGISDALLHIGTICFVLKEYDQALEFSNKSLSLSEEADDDYGIVSALQTIGSNYTQRGDYDNAIKYCNKALVLAKKMGSLIHIMHLAKDLSFAYKKKTKFREALSMYEVYIQMQDSLENEKTKKEVVRQEFKYTYDKKAMADSVRVAEEKKVTTAKLKQEQTQRYALYGGLCLTVIFGIFMFNRFRITRKQKRLIELQKRVVEEQKLLVEEKQQEVMDSIHYAKRIQLALLPSQKYFERTFNRLRK